MEKIFLGFPITKTKAVEPKACKHPSALNTSYANNLTLKTDSSPCSRHDFVRSKYHACEHSLSCDCQCPSVQGQGDTMQHQCLNWKGCEVMDSLQSLTAGKPAKLRKLDQASVFELGKLPLVSSFFLKFPAKALKAILHKAFKTKKDVIQRTQNVHGTNPRSSWPTQSLFQDLEGRQNDTMVVSMRRLETDRRSK